MDLFALLARKLDALFLGSGSMASVYSFFVALSVATLYLFLRRERRNLRLLRVILRRLLSPKIWSHRSSRLDVALLLLNTLLFPGVILMAVVSYEQIGTGAYGWLGRTFGEPPAPALPAWLGSVVITLVLFVAYEFAYWLDHFLSHKVPFLWAFHRVHHSAAVLTPLTNWRVHPVDTLVFFNLIAVMTGSAQAVTHYLLGVQAAPYLVQSENLVFLAYMYLYGHLQHSHVWMTFGGFWSKVFMSPAAHQVHHSTDPKHFDRNFGGAFAFWDWMFGTLYLPTATREVHEVGLKDDLFHDSVLGTMVRPFSKAIRRTVRSPAPSLEGRRKAD